MSKVWFGYPRLNVAGKSYRNLFSLGAVLVSVKTSLSRSGLLLPLILLVALTVSVVALTPAIPKVHAVGPPTLLIQPASRPAQAAGTTLTFNVSVANMPTFGGYDVYVRTNNNVLSPTTITLSTFLPAGFENTHCVNNLGTSCDANDGLGVAHESFASFGLTAGNGTLFTIAYSVGTGSGTSVAFPETVTSNTGLDFIADSSGFNITGVPEVSGLYGTLTTPDFSVSTGPVSPASILATNSGTSTVTVTSLGGFAGAVSLSANPSAGLLCNAVAGVTLVAGGTATSALTCSAATGADYTATVTGTSGTLSHTSTPPVTFHVVDFSISASPSSLTVVVGTPQTSALSFTAINGFSGVVSFSTSAASTGCTASVSGTVLTVSCTAVPTPATFTLTITGTTGTAPSTLSRTTSVSVSVGGVPTFTISLSPVVPSSVLATNSGTSTVTVNSVNGFAGAVSLSANPSNGLICNAVTGVTLVAGGMSTSALTCHAATGADYTATVTASGGTPTQTVTSGSVTFHVVDFSIAGPAITTLATVAGTSTVAVTPINGFTGTVTFSAGAVPSGCTASFTGAVLSVTCATGVAVFTVPVTGTTGTAPNMLFRTTSVSVTVQDFSVSAIPSSLNVVVGTPQTSTLSFTAINGFSGVVTFSTSAAPTGCTASVSGTVLSVSCTAVPTPATLTLTITGTTGSAPNALSRTTTVSVSVGGAPTFTVSLGAVTPASILATNSGTSTVTVTSVNGFAGAVSLTANPSAGLICNAVAGVTLTAGGSATSALTCHAATGADYTATVTGTGGTPTQTVTSGSATFHVVDFSVSAIPSSLNVVVGTPQTSTLSFTAINGFSGVVTFSTSAAPTGCTASVSGTVLTVSCTSVPTPATFTLTITGTTGSAPNALSRTTTVSVSVGGAPTFTVSLGAVTPASILATNSGTSVVTVTSVNNFAGAVSLTANPSAGLICNAVAGVTLTAGGSATSALTCHAATGADYTATVTGSGGTPVQNIPSNSVTFHVVDFSVSASPSSLNVVVGTPQTSTLSFTAINGFSGTVSFSTSVAPTGCTASVSGTVLTVSCTAVPSPATFTLTITGTTGTTPNTLSRTTTVSVAVGGAPTFTVSLGAVTPLSILATNSGTSTVTVTSVNGFAGAVSLTANPSTGFICNAVAGVTLVAGGTANSALTCSAATGADYTATVTGSGGTPVQNIPSNSVTFHVVDFSVSASPSSLNVVVGTPSTSTLSFTAINGFSGTVAFSTSAAPTGCTASVSGTVLTVSCTAVPSPATFTLTITGTTGTTPNTLSRTTTVSVAVGAVPTFTVSLGAVTPAGVLATNSGTSTVTVMSVNGFAGAVSLTASPSTGLICNAVAGVTLTAGGSATSALTCHAATGADYTATVTGSGGTPVQNIQSNSVTFHVVDFSVSASPSSLNVVVGTPQTSTLSFTAINGFSGTVSFSTSAAPTGCTASVSGTVLTVSCTAVPSPATFTLTITGTTGTAPTTLSRTTTVSVAIGAAPTFTVSLGAVTPSSILATNSGTSTVTVMSVNGFAGAVSLAASPSTGLVCNAVAGVTLVAGGTANSALNCHAATGADYTATVTGTGGTPTQTVTSGSVTFHVVDFSVSASPSSLSVTVGTPSTSTLSFTAINGFPGTVTFSTSAAPTGCTASVSGTVLTVSCTAVPTPATFILSVTGTTGTAPNTLSRTTSISVTVSPALVSTFTVSLGAVTPSSILATYSGTSTVTVTSVNGFAGAVSLAANPSTGLICSAVASVTLTAGGTSTSALTCHAATGADYAATVTGSGGTPAQTVTSGSATFHVVDFSVSASPSSLNVVVGTPNTSTLSFTAINGFSGTLTFSTGVAPTGCTANVSGTVLTVSCTAVPAPATFTLTITGTTGTAPAALSRTASVTVMVAPSSGNKAFLTFTGFDLDDFDNGVGQLNVLVNGQLVLDVPAGLNHLTGSGDFAPYDSTSIVFRVDITNQIINGPNVIVFLNPLSSHEGTVSNVTIVQGNTILLSFKGSQSISPERSLTLTFSNPPLAQFTVSATPNSIFIESDDSAELTITVTSQGIFAGTVCLTATGADLLSPTISPACVTVVAGGSNETELEVSAVEGQTPPGTYTITVTGTSGSLSSSTKITVVVLSDLITMKVDSLDKVSITSNGGVQTWTAKISNHSSATQYVQVLISGGTRSGTRQFSEQSRIVAVAPGAKLSLNVTHTFTSADIGSRFNFTAMAQFGPSAASLNLISESIRHGHFNVVA